MKSIYRVLLINILVLAGILFLPAFAFDIYKRLKLASEPPLPSEDLTINPAYSSSQEREKAQKLSSDKEAGMTYKSFVGWRRNPFKGVYKNVLSPYHNRLSSNSRVDASTWFFGGSTMWGTGAVDEETIPSWYAKRLNTFVFNLGESAWVSRQSLNQLINLLGDKKVPQRIIFYSGVNDILHGCRVENQAVPAHLQEKAIEQKIKQSNFDFVVSAAVPLGNYLIAPYKAIGGKLGMEISQHKNYSGMDCSSNPKKAELVADHLINNWYVAYLLAQVNGSEFYAILQPQVFSSKTATDYLHNSDFYLLSEYEFLYPLIKAKMSASCELDQNFCSRLLDGTNWLDGAGPVYIDFCHITGKGNQIIAEKIIQHQRNVR